MVELTRTMRFCLSARGDRPPRHNGYAAWPPLRGLERFLELHVRCVGQVDPETGYFLNIRHIDQAFRGHGLPWLEARLAEASDPGAIALGSLMQGLLETMQAPLEGRVSELTLQLSPYHSITIERNAMERVILRQQYEFAAAHRLHVPHLSEEENRELFGKCNNPSGHGHNYRLEVAVHMAVDEQGGALSTETLDRLVDEHVLRPLDHTHLNIDPPDFAHRNPSVENIARAIHERLAPVLAQEKGASLEEIRVWETEKTVCVYRGEGAGGEGARRA
jgi:6-pyruvoyltetrahydropterin/6-carboxytetrahydropterin synthase